MLEGLFPHLVNQVSEESVVLGPAHPVLFCFQMKLFEICAHQLLLYD